MPSSSGQLWPEQLWRYLTRRHKPPPATPIRPSHDPSRIASPSTNGPRLWTAEPRTTLGRVTSSFVSAHGRLLVRHERKSRVTLAARLAGKTPLRPFGHAGGVRSDRSCAAQVHHFRQCTAFARLAANHARLLGLNSPNVCSYECVALMYAQSSEASGIEHAHDRIFGTCRCRGRPRLATGQIICTLKG